MTTKEKMIQSLNEEDQLEQAVEPTPDLPNEIVVTWKMSDDMNASQISAITINGNPVEGVDDPEASILELAGFSCQLDIDEAKLGELLSSSKALVEVPGEEAVTETDVEAVEEPSGELDIAAEVDEVPFDGQERYMTSRGGIVESKVWSWVTEGLNG